MTIYRKVVVDDSSQAPESADDGGAFNNVESAQKQTRTLLNSNIEVINLSGLAEQRVKSNVWKTEGIIAGNRKEMIAAGVVNSM